jgi:hypothetical protein
LTGRGTALARHGTAWQGKDFTAVRQRTTNSASIV